MDMIARWQHKIAGPAVPGAGDCSHHHRNTSELQKLYVRKYGISRGKTV